MSQPKPKSPLTSMPASPTTATATATSTSTAESAYNDFFDADCGRRLALFMLMLYALASPERVEGGGGGEGGRCWSSMWRPLWLQVARCKLLFASWLAAKTVAVLLCVACHSQASCCCYSCLCCCCCCCWWQVEIILCVKIF